MIQIKTLSLPLVSLLIASSGLPALGEVVFEISSQKSYRQSPAAVDFEGGSFDIGLRDGNFTYQGGCFRPLFWQPNLPLDPCPLGATGFLASGDLGGTLENGRPYFSVIQAIPAIIVEPLRSDLVFLRAAPASKLPRPAGGFADNSYSLYFNLLTTGIKEYGITGYETSRLYAANERSRFEQEIVPGVYYYSFPRLKNPNLVAPIASVIYPMPEGYAKKTTKSGVKFNVGANQAWSPDGFLNLGANAVNTVSWSGISPSVAFPAVDKLYFSIRFLSDPAVPTSPISYVNPVTLEGPASLFPGFVSGGDPRVLLANPFVNQFVLPPIFASGATGVIELEVDRAFQTGGVTYDSSNRKFRLPIRFSDIYAAYAQTNFGKNKKKVGLLDDFDKDGFNNMTEWILGSRAADMASVPLDPKPKFTAANPITLTPASYGFTITKKSASVPAVVYTLQRSVDDGVNWADYMVSDANFTVTDTATTLSIAAVTPTANGPAGTQGHTYRVVVTLAP